MHPRETYTVEEFLGILRRIGMEVSVLEGSGDDEIYECTYGDVSFAAIFYGSGSNCTHVSFASGQDADENAFEFANLINADMCVSTAHVQLNENAEPELDDEGNRLLLLRTIIFFTGGVTPAQIEHITHMWVEDLYDFFGLDNDSESDDDTESRNPERTEEVMELSVAEQIHWVLQSGPTVQRTARELADFLILDKHTVNSALYRNPEMFVNDGQQPPRWQSVGSRA